MEFSSKELMDIMNNDDPRANIYMGAFDIYKKLIIYYQSAIDEVETKLRIIDRELTNSNIVGRNNTIHQIQSRVKKIGSIATKLDRKGYSFSREIVEEKLADVAGIRVICSYTDDIYMILDSLSHQTDVTILEIKDYIKEPKPSGYRSLHVILEIPVFFFQETKKVKVEIQFRTIAMDYWASLEHGLRYKDSHIDSKLSERLEVSAKVIAQMEEEMLAIRNEIEALEE
ncbi:(p)ppGpp synthetase [Vagococcus sp. DIV0080]|uniref:(P)ppGpp synthetase n=1 Tax=Candidatus Vagococcus giribetii TaxID=2230876 RepID=A0ABS3HS02_9ENTE|nr:(p)ppGpp synthetase [Vagococcus sp. DIV0080]MBO0476505.1 (p)ppGpp synthetase [Vagococcus sp. DIV0080]